VKIQTNSKHRSQAEITVETHSKLRLQIPISSKGVRSGTTAVEVETALDNFIGKHIKG
jgi:hypothetical protein